MATLLHEKLTEHFSQRDISGDITRISIEIGNIIGPSLELAQRNPEWETWSPEMKFLRVYALTMGKTLRKHLMAERPDHETLAQSFGGPTDNPHIVADLYGTIAFFQTLDALGPEAPTIHILHNEEAGFMQLHENSSSAVDAIQDPLDESNAPGKFQTSAIIFMDAQTREWRGGTIVSLVDERVLTIDADGQTTFIELNADTGKERAAPTDTSYQGNLRFATLPTRIANYFRTPLAAVCNADAYLPSMGGFDVLEILSGNLDLMIDWFKGQPQKEAVLWLWFACLAGLTVVYGDGQRTLTSLLQELVMDTSGHMPNDPRIPFFIAAPQIEAQTIQLLLK